MNKLVSSLILATGVVAFGGAAMAADIARPPPPVAVPVIVPKPAYDWSGHYIGIQGGYDMNSASDGADTGDINGGIAGIYGGFNLQHAGNWVVGLDASFNWDGATGSVDGASVDGHWKGFIRGRLGIAEGTHLFYATGGAVVANAAVEGGGTIGPWGWTAGAGVEWLLHDNWTGRIDWAYQDFGSFTAAGTTVTATSNTVMFGVAVKLQ